MKTKDLKRKQKAKSGGSLKPLGSVAQHHPICELQTEILIVNYGLEKLERDLADAMDRLQRTRQWLEKVRARISPNK